MSSHGGNTLGDVDPPTAQLLGVVGGSNVAAGGLLLVFSELIHNVIGVFLIALGLFVLWYRATHRVDMERVGRLVDKVRAHEAKEHGRKKSPGHDH